MLVRGPRLPGCSPRAIPGEKVKPTHSTREANTPILQMYMYLKAKGLCLITRTLVGLCFDLWVGVQCEYDMRLQFAAWQVALILLITVFLSSSFQRIGRLRPISPTMHSSLTRAIQLLMSQCNSEKFYSDLMEKLSPDILTPL